MAQTEAIRWRPFLIAAAVGFLLFALPYPIYLISLNNGSLPTEAEWRSRGGNHGPWRWESPGDLIVFSYCSLLLGSGAISIYGMFQAFRIKNWLPSLAGLAVGAIYVLLMVILLTEMVWTID